MQTAALCHVRYFMLEKYYEQVGDVAPGTPERLVLHRLATFYALSDVVVRAVVVVVVTTAGGPVPDLRPVRPACSGCVLSSRSPTRRNNANDARCLLTGRPPR